MKTSESIDQLAAALSIAQGQIKPAPKDKKSNFAKFASLSSIWEVIKEPLASNGLSVIQTPSMVDGRLIMTTRLLHKSGQWVEHELSIKPARDDAHSIGSACTYTRRYSIAAVLGISDTEDDDGEGAMGNHQSHNNKQSTGKPREDRQPQGVSQSQQKETSEPPKFNAQDPEQIANLGAALDKLGLSSQEQQAIANELHGKPRSHYHTIINKYVTKSNE